MNRSLPYDQLTHEEVIFALGEEIGDPELFVGRRQEMARLMKWADGAKRRISGSIGLLARRKKGKTALLQRFFNLLYTRKDPQLIPFYYRIQEERLTKLAFAQELYRSLISQYFASTTNTPELVSQVLSFEELRKLAKADRHVAEDIYRMEDRLENSPESAWLHAQNAGHRISQLNDVRILQILDEFQYLNRWIVTSDTRDEPELLCHSYMGAAESKFSPQIVAGSYVGWLGAILSHMTARYNEWHLEGLNDADALDAVYNYAYAYQVPVTEETAPYIAKVCENDAFYIAATIRNHSEEKDLTTRNGVREALTFETSKGQGAIVKMWNEYLLDAIRRVNDINARRIVLYLAAHDPEERTRQQIMDDLKLDLEHGQLEKRLQQLVMADILAEGSTAFRYKGLGDPIFAMIFRRLYGEEIEKVNAERIDEEFKQQLASIQGQVSWHKGQKEEYKVRYQLLLASLNGAKLGDLCAPEDIQAGDIELTLGPFRSIRKSRFYVDQEHSYEADLHAANESTDSKSPDLIVEVKAWEQRPPSSAVERFVEMKDAVSPQLDRPTVFLVYSQSGLGESSAAKLREARIAIIDPSRLASYEAIPN